MIVELKVSSEGYTFWFEDGKLHREDGWAVISGGPYGALVWYQRGMVHREDGPAVIQSNGKKYWYLNDYEIVKEEAK